MSSGKRFKFPGMTTSRPTGTASKTLIVRFYDYDVQAKDAHGRTQEDILAWSDSQLERCHNYIQMLFPVPEGSAFNWEAPIIDREVMEAFRSRSDLRDRLGRSFERMLEFYGFESTMRAGKRLSNEESEDIESSAETTEASTKDVIPSSDACSQMLPSGDYYIIRGPDFRNKSRNWAVRFDHNQLRITRILRCLRVLGLQKECDAFFVALKDVFDDPTIQISDRSMMYWQRAVNRPLYIAPDDDQVPWLKEWEEEQEQSHIKDTNAGAESKNEL
jgi:hypothetical protein